MPGRGRLLVLYGTQTGRAQDLAERVAREGARRRFDVAFAAVNDVSIDDLAREVRSCASTPSDNLHV